MKHCLSVVYRLPRQALMGLVKTYRLLLSPWLGNVCRFEPTCSTYALKALELHGAIGGTTLTMYRLLRCQPWCAGGHEAVPKHSPFSFFTRLVSPETSTTLSSKKKLL
jgi:putative membrane protein insertion efficiency factor